MKGYIKYIDEFRFVNRFPCGDPMEKERTVGFKLFLPLLNILAEVTYKPTHRKKVNILRCLYLNRTTFRAEPIIETLIHSSKQDLNWTKIKDILEKSDFSGINNWLYLQKIVNIPEDKIILYEI